MAKKTKRKVLSSFSKHLNKKCMVCVLDYVMAGRRDSGSFLSTLQTINMAILFTEKTNKK